MLLEELELWVNRYCFFNLTADEALQVLRDRLDNQTFTEIHSIEESQWKANPLAWFPPNDSDRQELFFRAIEKMCKGVEKMQNDYHALMHVSLAALTAMSAIVVPGYLFPCESPHPFVITLEASPRLMSINKVRKAAQQKQAPGPDMLYKAMASNKSSLRQSLELGDVILHTHPGTSEQFECTVMDFGVSRVKGNWFLVSYADNPCVEVELSDSEMGKILAHRITVV